MCDVKSKDFMSSASSQVPILHNMNRKGDCISRDPAENPIDDVVSLDPISNARVRVGPVRLWIHDDFAQIATHSCDPHDSQATPTNPAGIIALRSIHAASHVHR